MMIYYEVKKLISQSRFIFTSMMCIVLFGFTFLFQQYSSDNIFVKNKQLYESEVHSLKQKSETAIGYLEDKLTLYEDAIEYYRRMMSPQQMQRDETMFMDDVIHLAMNSSIEELEAKEMFYSAFIKQVTQVQNYKEYLAKVDKKASNLAKDKPWKTNQKNRKYYNTMREAYAKLNNIDIKLDDSLAFQQFSSSQIDTYFMLFLCLFGCVSLFKVEEKNDMNTLLYTTRQSGLPLAISKLVVMFFISVVVVSLFTLIKYGLCSMLYGSFDLTANIQGLSYFYTSPFPLTQFELIILTNSVLALVMFSMQVLLSALYKVQRNLIFAIVLYLVLFIVSAIMFESILENSYFVNLKYLNLYLPTQMNYVLSSFMSIDLFDFTLKVEKIYFIVILVVMIPSIFIYLCFFQSGVKKITFTLSKYRNNFIRHTHLYMHEWFKLLIHQKVLVILLIAIGIATFMQVQLFQGVPNTVFESEQAIAKAYETYGGYMNEEKVCILERKYEELMEYESEKEQIIFKYKQQEITSEEYEKKLNEFMQLDKEMVIFQQVYNDYEGIGTYLNYKKGFETIFSIKNDYRDFRNSLFIFIAFICMFCGIYTNDYEKGEELLYETTVYGGKKRLYAKFYVIVTSFVGIVMYYGSEFIMFTNRYPTSHWEYPVYTIANNKSIIFEDMPILGYFIGLIVIRFIVLLCAAIWMLYISKKTKQKVLSLFICTLIFILPGLLVSLGFTFLLPFSFLHILMGNILLQTSVIPLVILIFLTIIIARKLIREVN